MIAGSIKERCVSSRRPATVSMPSRVLCRNAKGKIADLLDLCLLVVDFYPIDKAAVW